MSQCSNMDIIQALIDLGSVSGTEWHIGNNAGTFEILNNCSGDILFSILNDGTLATGSNFSTNPEFLNQYSNITIGTQFGNYTLTSNYVLSTSNILVRRILREDIYSSNYTQSTSNYLILKANENDANASNYILTASNNLINKIMENDNNASNYIMYSSNNLILKANFNDTNASNYILTTSNNLINKIRENDNNASNYILTASNNLVNNTLRTSNNLINKMNENDNNSSNYIRSTSNNLINKINENDRNSSNYIRFTSNILAERINKYSVWEPTTSNIYYYSSGNVGIGTTTPQNKLHICETSTSNTKLTIQNNYVEIINSGSGFTIPSEIIIAGTTSGTIGDTDRYISFPYTSDSPGLTGQTQYTLTTTEALNFDILVIGGGGGGGANGGGGGGAGGYVYITNQTLKDVGNFTIKVGKGGQGTVWANSSGMSSSIIGTNNPISYTSLGGGRGGTRGSQLPTELPEQGGSGGGGGGYNVSGTYGIGQISIQNSTYGYGIGFAGANGHDNGANSAGGGGGGAGSSGSSGVHQSGGLGGNGVSNNITGTSVIYCAGGGGGVTAAGSAGMNGSSGNGSFGSGSIGGGPNAGTVSGINGIVIIRYRKIATSLSSASASIELVRGLPADANTDYKIGNFNGDFKIMSSTSNVDTNRLLLTSNGDMTINGSILPAINSNYNLGSFANKWKDLYLSGNSIFLDNTVISSDTSSNLNIKDTLGFYKNVNINNLQLNSSGRQIIFGVDTAGRLTYTASNITSYAISTASNLILTVDKGGTGVGTFASGQLLIGNGTSNVYQNTNLMWNNTTGNLGIGTSVPMNKLHICETSTSNVKLTIQNNYLTSEASGILPNEIVVAGTTSGTIGTTERYISFPYTSDSAGLTGQTRYTFTTTEPLLCDILIVAGGGAGGASAGGGGGAGGLIYLSNQNLTTNTYNIIVGKGGNISQSQNGYNSSYESFIAIGGGSGATMDGSPSVGGSGGGGSRFPGGTRNATLVGQTGALGTSGQGNAGGDGKNQNGNDSAGGGGGGAGGSGVSAFITGRGANGGVGLEFSITGTATYYAGGGGGGSASEHSVAGSGGLGGGGNGAIWASSGGNAIANTGGGGGGGSSYPGERRDGGNGGSGVVIIRYRKPLLSVSSFLSSASIDLVRGLPADANTDYKIGNFNGDFKIMSSTSNVDISRLHIDSSGNVGIGTSVPENKFHICDTIISDTRLTIQNNYAINTSATIPNEIVVAGTTSGTIDSLERYIIFPYTSDSVGLTGQTQYIFSTTENITCDILVVGGGGGGGQQKSGGGGAGGLILIQNFQANGNYTINVGKGGIGGNGSNGGNGRNGVNTTIIKSDNSVIITANGGGGGGGGSGGVLATNGGSGGGGGWSSANGVQTQRSQSQIGIVYPAIFNQFGEDGGHGGGGAVSYPGGGGGGAGGTGSTSSSDTTGQNGGLGINKVGGFVFSDKFTSNIGDNGWFSGGGGSGGDSTNSGFGNGGVGLYGGGGDGNIISTNNVNYVVNTSSQTTSASTILQVSTNISRWYAYTGAEITNVIISTDNWNQEQTGILATAHNFTWNNTTNLLTGYSTTDAGHFGCWGINLNNQVSYTLNSITYNKHYLLVRNINQIELTTIAYKSRSTLARDIGWLPNHFKIFGANIDKTDITTTDISNSQWVQLTEIKLKTNSHTMSFHKSGVFNLVSSAYTSANISTFFDTYDWTNTTQTFNTFLFMIINIGTADTVMNMDELAFRGIATTTTSTSRGRGINGINGTGGGGGSGSSVTSGGSGGSGVVMIKYRKTSPVSSASIDLVRGLPTDSNTDYKLGNYNGDFKIMSSVSSVDTNRLLLTSNGDMTLSGSIEAPTYLSGGRNIVSDSSNYVLSTSNLISQRITDLTTDMITENVNASKKFIVNNRYNNNLELNGTLTINSNLIVLGDSTRLDTVVYTTERLEIINANNTATAFMVQQNSADRDIIVASNMSTAVFRVANNGDVLINGVGVYKRNNRDVIWDTSNYVMTASNNLILKADMNDRNASNYVMTASNNLILRANAIDSNVSNYILSTSNNLILNAISNDAKISILCNTILAVGTINDTNASNYVLTASNNLILKADMNDRNASNYVLTASNNLVLKADMNDRNASNYVLTASNNLVLKADMNDRNASNYVLNTSNTLVNIIRARADAITTSQWTGSSNIYFNTGNVGIGTTNPSTDLHLYDEVIGDTKITIQNNSLVVGNNYAAAATITPSGGTFTTGQITSSVDQFVIFTAGSSSFTVPAGGLNCDILMIGGGGGSAAGGGGAGACIVAINQTLPAGSCVVIVGEGGIGGAADNPSSSGGDSSIQVGTITRFLAKGGGRSGYNNVAGANGGCGGGAQHAGAGPPSGGGVLLTNVVSLPNGTTTTTGPTLQTTYAVLGNIGGNSGDSSGMTSGSGGGIGAPGVTAGAGGNGAYQVTLAGSSTPINFRNYFVNGSTSFGVQDGTTGNYYIGGGGGSFSGALWIPGGLGGGTAINGIVNTGSGGSYYNGKGGSGIVIIRYRMATLNIGIGNPSIELIRGIASDSNTDYKIGNYGGDFKIMSSTSNIDTNRVLLTSNGDMTLSGSLNASSFLLGGSNILIKVDDTSNYIRSASNLISQRITNLTTDMITESATKKFIINNSYNNNLELNGTLTINSNLIVLGDSTRLDTIVYTTERLEIVNANNTTTALMVQQNSANRDIFVASNMSATVFKIANNGDVHINGNYNKNNRDVIQDTSNYILTTSNLLINYNNLINRPGLTQWVGNSNITYNLGNVGIGTTVPLERLHVVGDIAATNNITSYYSDERLKTKTGGIHEPLEIVGKLNGFYYIPNALANLYGITNTDTEIGLSAQDVQRVLPEIVNIAPFDLARDADDNKVSKSGENYLTISYERLAPVFVEAIKELKNEISLLKQRVAVLEK